MSSSLPSGELAQLISVYGYWGVAVIVALESVGVPLPAETAVIAVALYAAKTDRLHVGLLFAAAAAGSIIGDNVGYWIGREIGYRLLVRYGRLFRLTGPRLKLGRYLFYRYGVRIVFFGRFVGEVRTFVALLAGANRMDWRRFVTANVAGGILWAAGYSLGPFLIGRQISALPGWGGVAVAVAAVVAAAAVWLFVRRNASRLHEEAERAFPGPP